MNELYRQTDRLWGRATTSADLLKLNVEFIEGKSSITPYHSGPLDPGLLRLHELGIFTIKSQPFMSTVEEDEDDGGYIETRQRPSMDIVMADAEQAMQIWSSLKHRKDIKAYGFKLHSSETSKYERLDGTRTKMRIITKGRWARSKKELDRIPMITYSTVHLMKEDEMEDFFNEFGTWARVKPWLITVVGASWAKPTDLVEIIAEAAVQTDAKPPSHLLHTLSSFCPTAKASP